MNTRYHLFRLADRVGTSRRVATGVVVSFTTFPLRIGSAHLVVKSLLAQTVLPERVVLYLARDEFPDPNVGARLEALKSPRFDIVFIDDNVRAYNKLLHSLQQFPSASIITCDDDRIYQRGLVRGLVEAAEAHPGEVISWSARRIPEDGRGTDYESWQACSGEESGDILPLGFAGVLYPAGCLPVEVANRDVFLKLAPSQDDLWFKMMTSLNGVGSRTLGRIGRRHRVLPFFINRRLVDLNIAGGLNDRAVRALEGFYGVRFGAGAAKRPMDSDMAPAAE